MSRPRTISSGSILIGMFCALAFGLRAAAQSPVQSPSQSEAAALPDAVLTIQQPHHPFSTLDVLKEFERRSPATYVFGEGDEITVDVFGHPELSGRQVIGPDGLISLPIAGSVSLANLSREDGHRVVAEAFGKYYTGLSIALRVEVYASNRIFVLGRVSSPGVLHFENAPTLLEAITRAGSLPVGGVGADKAAMNRCVIFRGRDAVVWVDLKPLLKDGNLAYNIQLQRNDVLYIPDSDDQSVYVLGEVQHPGAYRLRPDMTFMDAYTAAGGTTKDGVPNHIQLIRPSRELNQRVSMRDIMRPDPRLNYTLADGDIIYVPKRGLAKFGYFMEQFGSASALAIVGDQLIP
ncbi:MAG: SLBB domain-containing protein [Terriglobales bacterium]